MTWLMRTHNVTVFDTNTPLDNLFSQYDQIYHQFHKGNAQVEGKLQKCWPI